MAKSSKQKQKLLYLQKILLEKTDEEHPMTLAEIKDQLAAYDIRAERKALYEDLEILRCFGLDICTIRSNTVRYYIGSRDFQVAELKLLVDAIQSSKFITRKKSLDLISKLERLVSENEGKQLHREVYVQSRVKTPNERIYYNVDIIHSSISRDRQISFVYFRWELSDDFVPRVIKKAKKDGDRYIVSPIALCWDDENYYLVAYDKIEDKIKHFRVDKMESITVLKEPRELGERLADFNPAEYAKRVFSMYGGEKLTVQLAVDNGLIGVIVDRFGRDIYISRQDSNSFIINVEVVLSPQFYAWIFGLGGKVKILSPKRAINAFFSYFDNFCY